MVVDYLFVDLLVYLRGYGGLGLRCLSGCCGRCGCCFCVLICGWHSTLLLEDSLCLLFCWLLFIVG